MCRYKIRKPRKWKDAKEFEKIVNEYFESCYQMRTDENGNQYEVNITPLTVRGLAHYLGVHHDTLCEWQINRDDIADTIKEAKDICHQFMEDELLNKNRPTIGVLFSLKNNWGWVDKQEVETKNTNINTTLDINFVGDEDNN